MHPKTPCYLIFILLWGAISACTETNDENNLEPSLVQQFSYQPGTYWIFSDSAAGKIDSYAVVSNTMDAGNNQLTNDEIVINTYNNGVPDTTVSGWILQQNFIQFIYNTSTGGISYPVLFQYPFPPKGAINLSTTDRATYTNIYSTLTLNGLTFNSVAQVAHTAFGYDDTVYISPGVGIVRARFRHLPIVTVLQLVRYHIVH